MARKKPISEPSAFVLAQRPAQTNDADRSNNRIAEFDAQREWEAHIAAGRIEVR